MAPPAAPLARGSRARATSRPEQARKGAARRKPRAAPAAGAARSGRPRFASLPFRVGGGAAPVAGDAVRLAVTADWTIVEGKQRGGANAYLWILTGVVLAWLLVGALAVRELAAVARRRAAGGAQE